jgi:hypothetical protein
MSRHVAETQVDDDVATERELPWQPRTKPSPPAGAEVRGDVAMTKQVCDPEIAVSLDDPRKALAVGQVELSKGFVTVSVNRVARSA